MPMTGYSGPRNQRHIADGQATGVNVGYGASILGRPMSANAAQANYIPLHCRHSFLKVGFRESWLALIDTYPTFRIFGCRSAWCPYPTARLLKCQRNTGHSNW